MNELKIFENAAFGSVRVIEREGQPWFVASDVAKSLGYRDAAAMTRMLDEDEKGTHIVCTLGGKQEVTVIS
ncbi:BRO-N domain-containing protein [Desulfovibrio falkowii]|uniref:Bro-N domain-containing protein n=1 Tax=Desulfovibrio falkowii TaxID=3136602 RepID=A0ABQ0E9V9_9BACT